MKSKYITTQILLACLSHKKTGKKDIHSQLEETIAERKKLLQQLEKLLLPELPEVKKDIHAQLAETIAERKRMWQQLENYFAKKQISFVKEDRRAA